MSRRVVSLVAVSRVTFVTNIYVGDLAFGATDDDLRSAFEQFGEVTSVNIIMDRDTGRSRGFAFVEMANAEEAKEAIESLDGTDIAGRNVKVNEARPREPRSGGGGGYGGGRGGGGYGGGGGGGRSGGGGGYGGGGGGRSGGGGYGGGGGRGGDRGGDRGGGGGRGGRGDRY
jgi:RNA recognition motif-containing protein